MAEIIDASPPAGVEEVGYYFLYNGSVGTYIWPQLRAGDNIGRIIWDGRDHGGYGLNVEQSVEVNLQVTKISGSFYIACNTKFGDDKYYGGQNFQYSPGSNRIVCGRAYGGARNGSVDYTGIKTKAQLLAEYPDAVIVPIGGDSVENADSVRLEPASVRGTDDTSTPTDASGRKP